MFLQEELEELELAHSLLLVFGVGRLLSMFHLHVAAGDHVDPLPLGAQEEVLVFPELQLLVPTKLPHHLRPAHKEVDYQLHPVKE